MERYLKTYLGYDSFRPLQREIITHILQKKSCLVLMPTGGGKSICFQIPALMMPGTAIVVSPLISLMKDQVESLCGNGIPAAALNSNYDETENRRVRQMAAEGKLKLLYISPEKLMAERDDLLKTITVSLIAIDEAHCISQWGHDFRPEYTQLGLLREIYPDVPIAAFTATADKVTKNDILEQLHIEDDNVFVSSFDRPNLSLTVRRGLSAKDKLSMLVNLISRHHGESGIIYCLSRRTTEDVAEKLRARGINASFYHAGMGAKERDKVQEDFIHDRIPVVCATIAFGMGINKSNVRFVVHYNMPKSMENYYQEIGRGGRDGLPCETILFYNIGDIITLRNFADESGQANVNNEKLDRMQEYAESQVCRRRILLNYFGEAMAEDCDNCDVCASPPQRFDGTIQVQKVLSAIMRTEQQVGFSQTIDILRGNGYNLRDRGFDRIKTFGAGRDLPARDWRDYMLQMLHLGYFEIDYKDDSHLKITEQGRDVLFGRTKAQLAVIVREDFTVKGRKQKNKAISFDTPSFKEDSALFEKLRAERTRIANETNVPPYVVLSDRSLHDIIRRQPVTVAEFGDVSGVGQHKQQLYGEAFVAIVRKHKNITPSETPSPISNGENQGKSAKSPRDFVTIRGVEYKIAEHLLDSIQWRKACDRLNRDMYYNFDKADRVPMTRYVGSNVPHHDEVVKRFAEIVTAAYGVTVTQDMTSIELPPHIEYDCDGKQVHTLTGLTFEQAMQQFQQFVTDNRHYPLAGSNEYECSLRRWYQEMAAEKTPVSGGQRLAFKAMLAELPDVPKNRAAWEKAQNG